MSVGRLARILFLLLDAVVLTASGVCVIVYLYRWEWNRALISALFFVIAEMALVAVLLVSRLSRMERTIQGLGRTSPLRAIGSRERADEPIPGRHDDELDPSFPWLGDGFGVFVPVLMGVGAILSAIAYVVEHLASFTGPGRNEQIEERLAAIDPPAAPLVSSEPGRGDDDLEVRPVVGRGARTARAVLVLLLVSLLVVGSVNTLADLTRNRPDPELADMMSVFTVQVQARDLDRSDEPERVVDALWISCRWTLDDDVTVAQDGVEGSVVRMRLRPAIARNAERRFVGCIEDLTLDGFLADVETFENVPHT